MLQVYLLHTVNSSDASRFKCVFNKNWMAYRNKTCTAGRTTSESALLRYWSICVIFLSLCTHQSETLFLGIHSLAVHSSRSQQYLLFLPTNSPTLLTVAELEIFHRFCGVDLEFRSRFASISTPALLVAIIRVISLPPRATNISWNSPFKRCFSSLMFTL